MPLCKRHIFPPSNIVSETLYARSDSLSQCSRSFVLALFARTSSLSPASASPHPPGSSAQFKPTSCSCSVPRCKRRAVFLCFSTKEWTTTPCSQLSLTSASEMSHGEAGPLDKERGCGDRLASKSL